MEEVRRYRPEHLAIRIRAHVFQRKVALKHLNSLDATRIECFPLHSGQSVMKIGLTHICLMQILNNFPDFLQIFYRTATAFER